VSAKRVTELAAALSTAAGITVTPEAGAPGRGDAFAFCDAPTYLYDQAALSLCDRNGRPPRMSLAVAVVGAGVAPGQMLALYDLALSVALAMSEVPGWVVTGDVTPGTYGDLPAFTVPVATI
jgi:hypothetical protein